MLASRIHRSHLLALLAPLALAAGVGAQTVMSYDGTLVQEIAGPPDPLACGYPDGAVVSSFNPTQSFGCQLPQGTPAGSTFGGVAVDVRQDTTWVSDGFLMAEYARDGTPLRSFSVSGFFGGRPISGFGFDALNGELWMTEGGTLVGVKPAVVPCGGGGTLTAGPFPLPIGAPAGDLDFDPISRGLWVADLSGKLTHVTTSGLPGTLGTVDATAVAGCGLGVTLLGVGVDTGVGSGPARLIVTDGQTLARIDPATGQLAPPTFDAPSSCVPVSWNQPLDVDATLRPVTYGAGVGVGVAPPAIDTLGQSWLGNPGFGVTLQNGTGGGVAALAWSLQEACPAIPLLGVPIYLTPTLANPILSIGLIPPTGGLTAPLPIPASAPQGLELHFQWIVVPPGLTEGPPLHVSNAIEIRLGPH